MTAKLKPFFDASPAVRYVALYLNGTLHTESKSDLSNASSAEYDRYEELIVNPAVLTLTKQRGNIDCGGCRFVLIRYGQFYQWVAPLNHGHVSVCVEAGADPILLSAKFEALIQQQFDNNHE